MEKETISRIYKIAKGYESAMFNAEELFQIGFIGNMKGEELGLSGEPLNKTIRNEIELFLKSQKKMFNKFGS